MDIDADALLKDALVWDNHGCMPLRPHDVSFLPQLARYKTAGVDVVAINAGFGEQGVEDHIRMIASLRHWLALNSDSYLLVRTVHDIARAKAADKLAVMFDIEGMNALADQASLVRLYYDLGVRWMLVAYNRHNAAGGGCQQDDDPGLTAFGREIVDEMARVGMVACCSHSGYRTSMDLMAYSARPVIFSHSNARAVHDHPRNVADAALMACAATGGVVGVNGLGLFIGAQQDGGEGALLDGLVRHIDHMVQLIGIGHVGLGLDYVFDTAELGELLANPEQFPPELGYSRSLQMVAPEALPDLVNRLARIGYAADDLRALLGGNLLRVAEEVWR